MTRIDVSPWLAQARCGRNRAAGNLALRKRQFPARLAGLRGGLNACKSSLC